MVRRSVLVYDLLRSERSIDGLSEKEILRRISDKYNIYAGKGLRRQIAVALRRGIDFGVVKKRLNKYRFDPDFLVGVTMNRQQRGRRQSEIKRKSGRTKRTTRGQSSTKKTGSRKRKNKKPKPKVPTLSPWPEERRDLRKEAIPRVVRHRRTSTSYPL